MVVASSRGIKGVTTPRPTEFEVVSELLEIATIARTRLARTLECHDVSWAGFEVLDQLDTAALPFESLAHRLRRHRTSIIATVSRLERSGLVERYLATGSREYTVELTNGGRIRLTGARRALDRMKSNLIPDDSQDRILEALRELRMRLDER